MSKGFALIADLYTGGVAGSTGGVLCGGAAMLLRWLCGKTLAFVFCVFFAILTLLGAMNITIPSIIRAIANRPKDDYAEEEDYIDPATAVVNNIASKQIARKRQRREQQRARENAPEETPPETPQQLPPEKQPRPAPKQEKPHAPAPQDEVKQVPGKGAAFMERIDGDINAPLSGTAEYVKDETPPVPEPLPARPAPAKPVRVEGEDIGEKLPSKMPEFVPNAPIPPAPKLDEGKIKPTPEAKSGKVTTKEAAQSARQVAAEIAQTQGVQQPDYCFPPLDLLKRPVRAGTDGTEEMRENSRRLNETLASFNIDAHIINVTRGPSVTRYEVELDKGVRLNKITGCADDIALSLGASGVRIAAVPGKISVVGIEVPNHKKTPVYIRSVFESQSFLRMTSPMGIALGKDIAGVAQVADLCKMPHLLIAGSTGSGKSVCVNSIIMSLLFRSSPEDVKLLLIDPKVVELAEYNGIPHLLMPVVTEPRKAAGALGSAVQEMERRYRLFAENNVRDIKSFNKLAAEQPELEKMPYIAIIIDELADLMMVVGKDVEDSICRIAQKARAAGMHLIVATQRPSVDVITGLIKANIPSRIAFAVSSQVDSRTILDGAGAEKLLGQGDMLFMPVGAPKPTRIQGTFVRDEEISRVLDFIKQSGTVQYDEAMIEAMEKHAIQDGKKGGGGADAEEDAGSDPMFKQAVDVVIDAGQASTSLLQRRCKLGYARAARIMDEMEQKSIIGPYEGAKPRAVLISRQQWLEMQMNQPEE